jgi:polyferredoxin
LKCAALALLMTSLLTLAASRYTLQASAHGRLLCHLLAPLTFLTSWVSSLDHQGTENRTGFYKGMCWATASFIHLINLSTPSSMSSQFSYFLGMRSSSLALTVSASLSAFLHCGLGTKGETRGENENAVSMGKWSES